MSFGSKIRLPVSISLTLLLAACGASNEVSETSSSAQAAVADGEAAPSAALVARAKEFYLDLAANLRADHPKEEGTIWAQTKISLEKDWIVQGPDRLWGVTEDKVPLEMDCKKSDPKCDKVFQRQLCEVDSDCETPSTLCTPLQASIAHIGEKPRKMCLGNGDALIDRFYNVVVSADHELDIASLFLPSGRFYTAMINGFSVLSEKESVPAVRMLYAGFPVFRPVRGRTPGGALSKIVKDLQEVAPKTYQRVRMNIGENYSFMLTYNHAKIVLADGKRLLEGGHNLLDYHYLGTETIFDLSMENRGEGAAKARDFMNVLWDEVGDTYRSFPENAPRIANFRLGPNNDEKGDVNTITVGRMGNLGPNVSDTAMREMIDLAHDKISVIQSDIYRHGVGDWERFESWATANLIRAAARGVQIEIILSNDKSKTGFATVNGEKEYKQLLDGLVAKMQDNDRRMSLETARAKACQRITIAPFRFSRHIAVWPSKLVQQPSLHTKFLMIDDAAFYIGSHNLYPAQLVEFGNIVADAKAATDIKTQYWDKMWAESKTVKMACPY